MLRPFSIPIKKRLKKRATDEGRSVASIMEGLAVEYLKRAKPPGIELKGELSNGQ